MSGANQVQVPVIQTKDEVTQIQQNVNKVARNLDNKIVVLQNTVARMEIIGDVIFSVLSIGTFQANHGPTWIQANGQSAVGTSYQSFTKNDNVPNISLAGVNAYIKVNR